jgi:hypothetical protein
MQTLQVRGVTLLVAVLLATPSLTALGQTSPTPAGAASSHIPRPDELEPGVDTTKSAPGAATTASTPAPSTPAPSVPAVSAPTGAAPPASGPAANAAPIKGAPGTKASGKKGADRLELEATDVTGNSELPKVLYIVPWKRSDLGDMVGRPVNSLLDEVLQPLDRDVFKRENRYYDTLKPQEAGAKSDVLQGSGAKP